MARKRHCIRRKGFFRFLSSPAAIAANARPPPAPPQPPETRATIRHLEKTTKHLEKITKHLEKITKHLEKTTKHLEKITKHLVYTNKPTCISIVCIRKHQYLYREVEQGISCRPTGEGRGERRPACADVRPRHGKFFPACNKRGL